MSETTTTDATTTEPSVKEIRAWALEVGVEVGLRGRLKPAVVEAYKAAHSA